MKFIALRPVIYTARWQDTVDFYSRVLGFQLAEKNEEWGWALLCRDMVEIMLAKPNAHMPFEKPVFTGSFYFTVQDVETFWQEVKDHVIVCYAPQTFEWGMFEFGIYDNNGYLLQFGQEIHN